MRLAGLGHLYGGRAIADAVRRTWWPVALLLALRWRRIRAGVVVALTVPPLLEWRADRPALDPVRWTGLRLVDDLAYGAGVWAGCAASDRPAPLADLVSWPGRREAIEGPPPRSLKPGPAYTGQDLQRTTLVARDASAGRVSEGDAGQGGATMPTFVAYHGVEATTHQQRVDELAPQGYRPISLSVSGDPADARYAAVWVQLSGPGWWAVHGLDAAGYQTRFDELVADGYAPVVVTATGPADGAIFGALFEQGVSIPWFARHNLRWDPVADPTP